MPIESKIDKAREVKDVTQRAVTWTQINGFGFDVDNICRGEEIIDKALMKPNAKGLRATNPNHESQLKYNAWDGDLNNVADYFAEITMYEVFDLILKPMTKGPGDNGTFPTGCSYMEIIAAGPQPPELFVSHYWGQPFAMFIAALKAYEAKKELGQSACFWIAGFAHRPWCLDQELGTSLEACPFAKVIAHQKTTTTVLVTSPECAAMKRLWCLFEVGKACQKRNHALDIVVGNDKFVFTNDASAPQVGEDLLEQLIKIDIDRASASKFADKHMLLTHIKKLGLGQFQGVIAKQIGQHLLPKKVEKGDLVEVQDLLDAKINVNASDQSSREGSALHMAVAASNVQMVKLLIKNKANVNDQSNGLGQSPVHKATDQKVLDALLAAGANDQLEDNLGRRGAQIGSDPAPKPKPVVQEVVVKEPEADKEGDEEDAESAIPANLADDIYDDLITLLASERPFTTKVNKGGVIRMPRAADPKRAIAEGVENEEA